MQNNCKHCRYRNQSFLEQPCKDGLEEIKYLGKCTKNKELTKLQKLLDRIRFKK